MRAGKRRHYVTVERPVQKTSPDGGTSESWETLFSEWASIMPLQGREYFQAAQAQSEVDTQIDMRYHEGVTSEMRVVCQGQVFDIQTAINVDLRDKDLQIMAKSYG